MHGREEGVLNAARDRARRAVAHDDAVHFLDRGYFDRRAGEKDLVGRLDVGEGQGTNRDREAEVARDSKHGVARDAHDDRRIEVVGDDDTVLHDEEVRARPFGDVAFGVEQQRLIVPATDRLLHGAHRIGVVTARLHERRKCGGVDAADGRHGHAHAVLRAALNIGFPRHRDDRNGHGAVLRPDAEAVRVEEGQRAQVGVVEMIRAHDFDGRGAELLERVAEVELVELRRMGEATHVRVETEDGRAVGRVVRPDTLEDASAVLKRVRGDMHLRGVPLHDLAVQPNELGFREASHDVVSETGKRKMPRRDGSRQGAMPRGRDDR
jgi:hypothetical protein